MIMIDWYKDAISKYLVVEGRSGRPAFWYFFLANIVILILLFVADNMLQSVLGNNNILRAIYTLIVFVPTVTLSVRRFHDIGKSGWWYLINFIPIIGVIIFLFFMAQPSQPSANEYGPKPS